MDAVYKGAAVVGQARVGLLSVVGLSFAGAL
jgi:hypothetical protein